MTVRVAVAVNPTSGQGRGAAAGEVAIAALQQAGVEVTKLIGVDAADLRRQVAEAVGHQPRPDALVLVGGDGMVHLGLGACVGSGVPLAIVAAGTGNDVARSVGLPVGDPVAAVEAVVAGLADGGRRRRIDVVQVRSDDDREWWFAGVLGAGFDAIVNERANGWTWPRGRAKYVLAMLRELPVFRARAYTVTIDGSTLRARAMLVAVGNGPSYGGGMRVLPDAQPDDGLLDVVLVRELSKPAFLRIFPRVYGGTHVRDPRVVVARGRTVTLEVEPHRGGTVVGYADGERLGPLPLTCTILPAALTVLGGREPVLSWAWGILVWLSGLPGSVGRVTSAEASSTGPTPAERFAAARRRQAQEQDDAVHHAALEAFRGGYEFALDDFQLEACRALEEGRGVLVAAPTGSGKTVVGEFAVHLALTTGRKAFYTTPIKALSNQKYADLVKVHGQHNVGLLTGDNTVNGDAPVVVMTTEVLRNMLYADSPQLAGLGYVVMDEVHYLADRFRGAVWEEVIIHLPDDVLLVSLSATVSNAEEFGAWLDTVRGNTSIVVSEVRPVPLWQHVMTGNALHDLFVESEVNPDLRRLVRDANQREWAGRGRGPVRGGKRHPRGRAGADRPRRGARSSAPSRPETIATLDAAGLLPMITFVFSRAGCDAAVLQCLHAGLRLTNPAEQEQIRQIVDARCAEIPEEDLTVLGYWEWVEALSRGLAAHHAGMLPAFKEVVEELFTRGLVKAVFATETLALGINMPARSVVLEKLVKWNGETHADVTPGEYTQLTGRAGRRGIDVEGHAVVLWHPGLDPEAVGGLASTRTYPLRSSFRPTYNMAVNLVGQVGRNRARDILETSFAQFQADRAVVGLARQARKQEEAMEGYAEAMKCHLGDFREYAALRRKIGERETQLSRAASRDRRSDVITSLEKLRRGDIIRVPGGRRPGWAVVLDPGVSGGIDGPRTAVLTIGRQVRRLSLLDVPTPVEAAGRVTVPKNFNGRDAAARRDLASALGTALGAFVDDEEGPRGPRRKNGAAEDDEELSRLRRQLRSHPCHGCAEREDHARWAERWWRLRRETDGLVGRIEGRTNTIARVFDRVCDLLDERGYLAGDTVTPAGKRLRRIYSESDLLVTECLRAGVWDDLDAAGLAACVSAVVYESRRDERGLSPRVPGGAPTRALGEMERIWSGLDDQEREHRLDVTPEPDLGLAWAIHRWAVGQSLEAVLRDADLAAGDFVRWCKQVIDLLGQVQQAAEPGSPLRKVAEQAVDAIRRGVVAHSSLV